jgi:hypothetical protein
VFFITGNEERKKKEGTNEIKKENKRKRENE